jgi:hypothetical protein
MRRGRIEFSSTLERPGPTRDPQTVSILLISDVMHHVVQIDSAPCRALKGSRQAPQKEKAAQRRATSRRRANLSEGATSVKLTIILEGNFNQPRFALNSARPSACPNGLDGVEGSGLGPRSNISDPSPTPGPRAGLDPWRPPQRTACLGKEEPARRPAKSGDRGALDWRAPWHM